jgi:hypothetical protein
MAEWHSVFVQATESSSPAEALRLSLAEHGYQAYDPFPGGMGTPPKFRTFARVFVGPATDGWVRLIGDLGPDRAAVIEAVAAKMPVLEAVLSGDQPALNAYGAPLDSFAKAGHNTANIQAALHTTATGRGKKNEAANTMPAELADYARSQGLNPNQLGGVFNRMSQNIFGQLGRQSGENADSLKAQAGAMLASVDWESDPARRLSNALELTSLPNNWRLPDFVAVRDAYQSARMLARNAKASLLPYEKSALQAVPNVMEHYTPLFMGK